MNRWQIHIAADMQEGFCSEGEHGGGTVHKWSGDPLFKASPQVTKVRIPAFLPKTLAKSLVYYFSLAS